MRRTDLSLDDEITEVERRLSQRRRALRALTEDTRSGVAVKSAVPLALVAAIGIGFAASRFVRRPQPRRRVLFERRPSTAARVAQVAGAVASVLLPRLIGPLQTIVTQYIKQRMRQPSA